MDMSTPRPSNDTQQKCRLCGMPVSVENCVTLNQKTYCFACLESLVDTIHHPPKAIGKLSVFLLSLVPGLGHLAMGLRTKGFQLLTAFFGSILLATISFGFEQLALFVFPMLIFYSVFDAQHVRKQIQSGFILDKGLISNSKQMELVAIVLLTIGGIEILERFTTSFPMIRDILRNVERSLPALLLVMTGFYFLSKRKEHTET